MPGKPCSEKCECGRHTSRTVEVCYRIGQSNKGKHENENKSHICPLGCICKRHQLKPSPQAMAASIKSRQEKGQTLETRDKISRALKGKVIVSEIGKQQRSINRIKYLATHSGHFKDTWPERQLEKQLQEQGLKYEKQKRIGDMIVDFYLPQRNLVIEVDGCWWHGCVEHCPTSRKPDNFEARRQTLSVLGYQAIRIWEHEFKNNMTVFI